jgi:hypothetical protein
LSFIAPLRGIANRRRAAPRAGTIKIQGPEAFEGMRKAGALAAATLDFITPYAAPISTLPLVGRRVYRHP